MKVTSLRVIMLPILLVPSLAFAAQDSPSKRLADLFLLIGDTRAGQIFIMILVVVVLAVAGYFLIAGKSEN